MFEIFCYMAMEIFLLSPSSLALGAGGCPEKKQLL
jgi:hypothetical protein